MAARTCAGRRLIPVRVRGVSSRSAPARRGAGCAATDGGNWPGDSPAAIRRRTSVEDTWGSWPDEKHRRARQVRAAIAGEGMDLRVSNWLARFSTHTRRETTAKWLRSRSRGSRHVAMSSVRVAARDEEQAARVVSSSCRRSSVTDVHDGPRSRGPRRGSPARRPSGHRKPVSGRGWSDARWGGVREGRG